MKKLLFITALAGMAFLCSCKKQTYSYYATVNEEKLSGQHEMKILDPKSIKAETDSIAYIMAYRDFCISRRFEEMYKSTTKTIDFALYTSKTVDISKTVKFIGIDSIKKSILEEAGKIQKPTNNYTEEKLTDEQKLKQLMKNESQVKDYIINSAKVLYVVVSDDGTGRDGFAEYICSVMKDAGIAVRKVRVMKLGSTKDKNRYNAYGILLGESSCN